MKIKTGDNVRVLSGKDKGKEGKVTQIFPKSSRVIVDGVNKMVKHLRSRGSQAGQRIEFFGPIHASNVQIITKGGKTGRVGYKMLDKDGKKIKVRVVRKGKTEHEVE